MAEPGASPIKAVIFDFDGTLSNSGDWFLTVVNQLARRFRFREVGDDEIEMLRHRTSREVIAYLGISRWKLPIIARHVRQLVARNVDQIELFPGTPGLLATLATGGVRMGLVTSNAADNARAILGAGNAGHFEAWAAGSSLFGKARKFRRVLRQMGLAPNEVISIGDETRDIDAAREVGMRTGAVSWGYASEDALIALRPDAFFRTPDDIVAYLRDHR
ncbi:HAD hydrolase-like protein [Sphingomonas sp.]|uniref:HAD hydrolase-like protein n=1 Tax=Sphingomonas sp. TaxID=28214 RepID=UPI002C636D31|nr:HAD hydrolase-like protein [Sphingomonas sp.]HWK36064.1 HAD hydrolase-like protein [Sphingomonas sp.]